MKCKIGQLDRCESYGYCAWKKVFGFDCKKEDILLKVELESKKQEVFPILNKKQKAVILCNKTNPKNKRDYLARKRRKIYDRGKGICYLCGESVTYEEYTIDHIIPRSKGGSSKYENLRPTHFKCNQNKGDNIL